MHIKQHLQVKSQCQISLNRAMSIEEAEDDDIATEDTTAESTDSNLTQQGYNEVVILDCQNPSDYHECHIRGAINVTFPAILIRRIAAGNNNTRWVPLFSPPKANTRASFYLLSFHAYEFQFRLPFHEKSDTSDFLLEIFPEFKRIPLIKRKFAQIFTQGELILVYGWWRPASLLITCISPLSPLHT